MATDGDTIRAVYGFNQTNEEKRMYNRSPELMRVQDSVLLVVDVQEKLIPHIAHHENLIRNVGRLVDAAKLTTVPVMATEQYPKGLGATVAEVKERLPEPCLEKLAFSCVGDDVARKQLAQLARQKVLLCGVETHVCIQQTAFDLMAEGYQVFLPVDAVSSRDTADHDVAIRRMESHGVVVTTVEACLFEWCEQAGTDLFKEVRKLV